MWETVKKDGESLGMTATTVGELKEMLKNVPDDYDLSVIGQTFGMLINPAEKIALFDEISYLEDLLNDSNYIDELLEDYEP